MMNLQTRIPSACKMTVAGSFYGEVGNGPTAYCHVRYRKESWPEWDVHPKGESHTLEAAEELSPGGIENTTL